MSVTHFSVYVASEHIQTNNSTTQTEWKLGACIGVKHAQIPLSSTCTGMSYHAALLQRLTQQLLSFQLC